MDIEKIIREITQEVERNPYRGTAAPALDVNIHDIPAKMEHSMLNPDITRQKILEECEKAIHWGFATICVAPYYVGDAAGALLGTGVAVCSAVGFPHGAVTTKGKLADLKECIMNGASEIDVAMNILAVKSGDLDAVKSDFEQVMNIAQGKAKIKAVFEHSVYTEKEKLAVLNIAKNSGAQFVKIQNVLGGKAADPDDVRFVRNVIGRAMQIKIDGGVKTVEHAVKLIAAGADRIGLTASVDIAKQCR